MSTHPEAAEAGEGREKGAPPKPASAAGRRSWGAVQQAAHSHRR